MVSDFIEEKNGTMFFVLLADELYSEKFPYVFLKDDFIIPVEIMDDYRKNMEDEIFVFKKFNWSLKEYYSMAYGSRQYQLMKIDHHIKSINEE